MENEAKLRLKSLGEKILETSRSELYLSMRFLDMAFAELKPVMNLSTFLIGTEGLTLQYNPRFLIQRYQDNPVNVNRAYLHTILHCLFRHMYIREDREEEVFSVSCDIAVEYLIDQMEFPSTKRLVSDFRLEWYERLEKTLKVLTAEGIYQRLMEAKLSSQELVHLETSFLVDDHQFWDAKKKESGDSSKDPNNQPKGDNDSKGTNDSDGSNDSKDPKSSSDSKDSKASKESNQSKESKDQSKENSNKHGASKPSLDKNQIKQANRWKELSEKTKVNAEAFTKQAGDEVKKLLFGLQVANRERYDYKEFLRKFAVLVENIQVDDNSFDYAFYSYGMEMYHNIPLIEPLEYKESFMVEEFVIAIDTSGSCSEQLIQKFVEETFQILKSTESYGRKLKLHIIQCDNEVKEDILIEDLEQLKAYQENFIVKGFGGTDYRPVFSYVEQLRREKKLMHLKGLLYFTDGYGIFPEKRTDYETAFIFIDEDNSEVKVPPWAMKLVFESKDITVQE